MLPSCMLIHACVLVHTREACVLASLGALERAHRHVHARAQQILMLALLGAPVHVHTRT